MPKVVERGESVMTISAEKIMQLIERSKAGQFTDSDIDAFMKDPHLWRQAVSVVPFTIATAQAFWQTVYDELLGPNVVKVPVMPRLTKKQTNSLDKFGFMLVYIPSLVEEQYPAFFVKPRYYRHLTASAIIRKPLSDGWVAVETIAKPHSDINGFYQDDMLMCARRKRSRFYTSWNDLTVNLIASFSRVTGFPKKGTRLPTGEEWNFIGNLFNWLREHRGMDLPDLGSTRSREWCENVVVGGRQLLVGHFDFGGLADVHYEWRDIRRSDVGFRLIADL